MTPRQDGARLGALLAPRTDRQRWAPTSGSAVVVYGAGATGRDVVRHLMARGISVRFILDARGAAAWPESSVPIYAPDHVKPEPALPILVGVHNRDVDPRALDAQLRARGWRDVVSIVDVRYGLPELGDRYWLTDDAARSRSALEIESAYSRLADARSRGLFLDVLEWRLSGNPEFAPEPSQGAQYFPDDVAWPRRPLRFVDGGAYDGDTLRSAAHTVGLQAAWALEPDATNFLRLVETARGLGAQNTAPIECWPLAIGARTEVVRFAGGAGEASHADANGSTFVQCVALDDVLPNVRPSMLKLDIEGAEPDALLGASRLVAAARPTIAVCVYHRPDHLWTIVNQLAGLGLDYSFFLRAHAWGSFDLVLYAVPLDVDVRTPLP